MKAKIAGVALAAMVGLTGLTLQESPARAAQITFATYVQNSLGVQDVSGSFDTQHLTSANITASYVSYVDPSLDFAGHTDSGIIQLFATYMSQDPSIKDITIDGEFPGAFGFALPFLFVDSTFSGTHSYSNASGSGTITVVGDIADLAVAVGPVPLPSAAGLFGFALLMVGGVGYAQRSRLKRAA